MSIGILHTADLHVGMRFASREYPPAVQEALVEARFKTLDSIVGLANERKCDLLVVSGDLFDRRKLPKKQIARTAKSLGGFEGALVLVLPGNHDYVESEEDSLWDPFRSACGDSTVVLAEPVAMDLGDWGLDAVVYPAPCRATHSSTNALGWLDDSVRVEERQFHIGVAHGSLEGVSPDLEGSYYPMSVEELEEAGMDVWLLGHTHVRHPDLDSVDDPKVLMPATPEPDGFDCRHRGHVWLVELRDDGCVRSASIETGRYGFFDRTVELSTASDLDDLVASFEPYSKSTDLIRLRLTGSLPGEVYDELGDVVSRLEDRVLYLELVASELSKAVSKEDIDSEFAEGSFPHRMLSKLADESGDPLALQMAYDLIKEMMDDTQDANT